MIKNLRSGFWIAIIALIAASIWYGFSARPAISGVPQHYGFFSLVPALTTLVICFHTRNVILGLFIGIVLGGLITARYNIIDAFLIPGIGSKRFAQILLVYLWALGGLIGMWNKNGGAQYFANLIARHFVKTRRSAKFFVWMMGMIFHQGGTISTVLTGTTVRAVADREKVSHEELSYIVDSTASPVATIIPFNAWPAYIGGLIAIDSLSGIILNEEMAVTWFFKALPLNFYGWLAVTFTLLFSLDKMFFVGKRMKSAIDRAVKTGKLDSDTAEPMLAKELNVSDVPAYYQPGLLDFLIPIGVLIGFSIIPWLFTGAPLIFEAFGLSVISAMVTSRLRGMRTGDVFDGFINGIKGVTVGAIILALAVTLGNVSESLGTSLYIIDILGELLRGIPYILPSALLIICMLVAFSIGSSWGTYAVVYPIALPLALSISSDPFYFTLNFAAILGGGVFGDQCSPISDTTILSAMACGADLMDHVLTQLPMALLAAGISALLYVIISYITFL
jgi:Na+/H+ antiporter NhaC